MRIVRFGAYLAVASAVPAIEGSIAGLLFALAGMVVTAIVGNFVLGIRAHSVVIGLGPRVAEWRTIRRTVVVRAFPLFISVEARRRTIGIAAGAVIAALSVLVSYEAALGGAAAVLSMALVRRRQEETPGVLQVVELVQAGELDAAERLVHQLTVANPQARRVRASRVLVLEARGRYAEALALAIGMSEADGQEAAAALATVAGLTGAAIEAGQLDAQQGLPVAARAVNEAVELGKPSYMLDGVRALIALLAGDPQLAVRLARASCKNNDGSLGRADDLATLARAYMAAGDNSKARETLAKAERLVPWWPRVALTRSRLDLAQA
ncbi:hypothetical protein LWC34_34805 [Kibdelosporangium philippinense]|uniref:Tetratricopeptide repeat protein n=1 Tax=Kibdelosporangium philippinense TaxID=211113 RepID=A0ABS8ZJI5_9PSEU|nr:hypothetical protein [Kibdelosporangium philippinense]MCE7007954.1 hypothetical protein [Kibdelosporangium philippinense]